MTHTGHAGNAFSLAVNYVCFLQPVLHKKIHLIELESCSQFSISSDVYTSQILWRARANFYALILRHNSFYIILRQVNVHAEAEKILQLFVQMKQYKNCLLIVIHRKRYVNIHVSFWFICL